MPKIRHVVIIFQENRSTDNLFNGLPGADTVRVGLTTGGGHVRLKPVGLTEPYDLDHAHSGFVTEYADGKLDGFDRENSNCIGATVCIPRNRRAYGYVPRSRSKAVLCDGDAVRVRRSHVSIESGSELPRAPIYCERNLGRHHRLVAARRRESVSSATADRPAAATRPAGSLVPLIDAAGVENRRTFTVLRSRLALGSARPRRAELALLPGGAGSGPLERARRDRSHPRELGVFAGTSFIRRRRSSKTSRRARWPTSSG